MNHHAIDIPSLPPLASGIAEEAAANDIQAGDAMNDENVIAAQNQYKNRKKLRDVSAAFVTDEELVSSKKRKHVVQSVRLIDPVQPPWAVQMQQQMNQMLQQMNQMQQQMHQMHQMKMNLLASIIHEAGRTRNLACIRTNADEITRLARQVDGAIPPANVWFPNHNEQISGATGPQLNALLEFYGLGEHGTVNDRRQRLRHFLGISI
jgi:hypothetical protein